MGIITGFLAGKIISKCYNTLYNYGFLPEKVYLAELIKKLKDHKIGEAMQLWELSCKNGCSKISLIMQDVLLGDLDIRINLLEVKRAQMVKEKPLDNSEWDMSNDALGLLYRYRLKILCARLTKHNDVNERDLPIFD